AYTRNRSQGLQDQFGPEYERAVGETGSRREAEAELLERRTRYEELDIRPLPQDAAEAYAREWQRVQAGFVDEPERSFVEADRLVVAVMRDRGYPMGEFDQRAADVSVDHPDVVEHYRAAHAVALEADRGRAETEDLRQGMVHYRALFEDLLDDHRSEVN
ncbi:MAG TPA: hypothetical protein VF108_05840, partial [Actinomycetota bacterium]